MSDTTTPTESQGEVSERSVRAGDAPVNPGTFRGSETVFTAEQTTNLVEKKKKETIQQVQQLIEEADLDRISAAVLAFKNVLSTDPNRSQWSPTGGIDGVTYALKDVKNLLNAVYKALDAFMDALGAKKENDVDEASEPEET